LLSLLIHVGNVQNIDQLCYFRGGRPGVPIDLDQRNWRKKHAAASKTAFNRSDGPDQSDSILGRSPAVWRQLFGTYFVVIRVYR